MVQAYSGAGMHIGVWASAYVGVDLWTPGLLCLHTLLPQILSSLYFKLRADKAESEILKIIVSMIRRRKLTNRKEATHQVESAQDLRGLFYIIGEKHECREQA